MQLGLIYGWLDIDSKTQNTQKLISSWKKVKRHVCMILDEKWNEKSAPPPILHINIDLLMLMPSVSQGNKYKP